MKQARAPKRAVRPARQRFAPGATSLAAAARVVATVVFRGRNADETLSELDPSADRAAIRAITLGTLRWYLRIAPAIGPLMQRPPESLAPDLRALVAAAAHQIEYSRNAPEATVNVAVDAARVLGLARASGFVNAVLRRFVAQRQALFGQVDADLAVRTAHPRWMVDAFERDWPEQAADILAADNAHPPMVLRLDLTRTSVAAQLHALAEAGLSAQPVDWLPSALVLEKPTAIESLPGFSEGLLSVQDSGAQLAAPLLDPRPGMRVLDACAAPGGKTGHLLEWCPDIDLTAVDIDPERLTRVADNLRRLRRTARVRQGDLRVPGTFWDERPFDRVLLDAPCSSTGVIRRHPDIKVLRRESDVAGFAQTQLEMLRAAFGMLARGGRLLYSTCSVLRAENDGVIEDFLAEEGSARRVRIDRLPPGALRTESGIQLLPGARAGTDGFHYACLEKATAGT
jgi:16S rRNA (cytosine967-C5)-methyltransferase